MPSYKKIIGNALLVIAIIITTFIALDLIAYISSPSQGIAFVPAYKKNRFQEKLNAAVHYFPRGYNVADPVTGFDIQKNIAPVAFNMADGSFPIFSNDIGCFDHHTLAEIKAAKSYDFFAGDSFAWGYGNYEKNNIRFVTSQQNSMNRRRRNNGSSKYKNVSFNMKRFRLKKNSKYPSSDWFK